MADSEGHEVYASDRRDARRQPSWLLGGGLVAFAGTVLILIGLLAGTGDGAPRPTTDPIEHLVTLTDASTTTSTTTTTASGPSTIPESTTTSPAPATDPALTEAPPSELAFTLPSLPTTPPPALPPVPEQPAPNDPAPGPPQLPTAPWGLELVLGAPPAPGSACPKGYLEKWYLAPNAKTYGSVPPVIPNADPNVDPRLQGPDYFALCHDGVVLGYTTRADTITDLSDFGRAGMPVYADDGTTVVGHVRLSRSGRRFVPVGQDTRG